MIRILKEALNFMLPYSCLICGNVSDYELIGCHVCKSCLSKINPEDKDKRWHFCLSEPFEGDKYPKLALYVPFSYQDKVVQLVYGLKFGEKESFGTLMGYMLASCLSDDLVNADIIVPIPLSSKRLKERGYNQAEVISDVISKRMNIPLVCDLLVRNRNTNRQAKCKSNEDRVKNVSGAFECNVEWDIENLSILLVDDVVTTGNTMHEAASVLLDNGAKEVLCVAFASNRMIKNNESY